jgi:16S rRNA (uracil1498-N3)-methyltransferase
MNRLKVDASAISGGEHVVRGDSLSYVRDVLRLRAGDPIELFDGEGHAWPSKLERFVDDGAIVSLGARIERPFTGVRVTLLQGLAKADKLELVVQKAVELGASALVPVAMERSVVKLDAKKAADRAERWQKIADEAARQSTRADTMRVEPVQPLAGVLGKARKTGEIRIVLDEDEKAKRLREVLGARDAEYVVLIGPEGGITREEIDLAKRAGFVPVTLGPRVLRTETAGLAVLSILQHVLGDLG